MGVVSPLFDRPGNARPFAVLYHGIVPPGRADYRVPSAVVVNPHFKFVIIAYVQYRGSFPYYVAFVMLRLRARKRNFVRAFFALAHLCAFFRLGTNLPLYALSKQYA